MLCSGEVTLLSTSWSASALQFRRRSQEGCCDYLDSTTLCRSRILFSINEHIRERNWLLGVLQALYNETATATTGATILAHINEHACIRFNICRDILQCLPPSLSRCRLGKEPDSNQYQGRKPTLWVLQDTRTVVGLPGLLPTPVKFDLRINSTCSRIHPA